MSQALLMDPAAVAPIAVTTRSGAVESVHHGVVVALAADGSVVLSAGDPSTQVYPRSSLKPLQAEAMLAAGLDVTQEQLAIACASHRGQPVHLEVVRSLLASAGLAEDQLQNTPDRPLDPTAAADVIRAGGRASSLLQNCSGKHAAMLATCVVNGWDLDSYLDVSHPLQVAIDRHIAARTGGVLHSGIDGCGAPTAAVTLEGVARAFAAVATSAGDVFEAMTARPDLVSGEGGDDTALMRAVPGLVVKGGAEGVVVAALADGRAVAIKVADGAARAGLPVLLDVLDRLGVDTGPVAPPPILGHGRPVGETRSLLSDPHPPSLP